MNIIQATPSIYATKHSGNIKPMTRLIQKESIMPPDFSAIVTLSGRLPLSITYNGKGILGSPTDDLDAAKDARMNAAKDAALDKNTRLSASIAANTAYAYAVSLLYVNLAAISFALAKKSPKVAAGIQPVSPTLSSATTPHLAR